MKNIVTFYFLTFCLLQTKAQLTYVPDDAFESYIETYVSGASNGNANDNYVNTFAIQNAQGLSITSSLIPSGIVSDFTGLEAFNSLNTMVIQNMNMLNIDLSNLYIITSGGLWDFQITIQNCNLLENLTLPQGGGIKLNISNCISLKNIVYHPNNILEGQSIIGSCPSLKNFDISMVSFIKLQSTIWLANNSSLQCINLKNGYCSNWNSVGITNSPLVTCVQVDNPTYCYTASGTTWNADPNIMYSTNCNCQVGIGEFDILNFRFYPNPTSGKISIKTTDNFLNQNYKITDQFGRIILESCFEFQENQIDLSQFKSGMYFLKIEGKEEMVKILKD